MTINIKIGKDLSVKESCTDTHTLIYIEMITNKIILIMFVISDRENDIFLCHVTCYDY